MVTVTNGSATPFRCMNSAGTLRPGVPAPELVYKVTTVPFSSVKEMLAIGRRKSSSLSFAVLVKSRATFVFPVSAGGWLPPDGMPPEAHPAAEAAARTAERRRNRTGGSRYHGID